MQEFFRGINRALGVSVGYVPIAMSFGAIASQSGISSPAAVAMSFWVYGGASQFAALEGVRQNLFWPSVVLTMLLINIRHLPMSLASSSIFSRFGRGQQLLLAHGLTDEAFVLDLSDKPRSWTYYAGIHLLCWISWVLGTWLGCQLGSQLPAQWLRFALPSLFLCLLIDCLRSRWSREVFVVLGVGIALALVAQSLGMLGILLSILGISVVASFLSEAHESTRL